MESGLVGPFSEQDLEAEVSVEALEAEAVLAGSVEEVLEEAAPEEDGELIP